MNTHKGFSAYVKTKFCKDCRWFREGLSNPRCAYPPSITETVDYLVMGDQSKQFQFCRHMRQDDWKLVTPCGKEGRFWEPKQDGQKEDLQMLQ